jgi:hypothetical protein
MFLLLGKAKMIVVAEEGLHVPQSAMLKVQDALNRDPSVSSIPVVSFASTSHSVDFFSASLFVRIDGCERDDFADPDIEYLMRKAAIARHDSDARVGAALQTTDGQIFTAVESRVSCPATKVAANRERIEGALVEFNMIDREVAELIDLSTSSHAERVFMMDCLSKGMRPLSLSTKMNHCLACCLLIRMVEVPLTTYLSVKGRFVIGHVLSALISHAMGDCKLQVFQGRGGRL